jgi:hypothetical protein
MELPETLNGLILAVSTLRQLPGRVARQKEGGKERFGQVKKVALAQSGRE